jgi:formate/nitrite transporter FocA (FNT family)
MNDQAPAHDTPQEEAQKSYHTVLEQHVQQAQEELDRPATGLLLSSFSAGLDIGFGPFLMAVIATLLTGTFSRPLTELLTALAYTLGFVLVIVGRSALFTEQTTSAVLPVLAGRVAPWRLFRLWALVLAGNLVGGALMAVFISYLGRHLGIVEGAVLASIADKLIRHPSGVVLVSAVAAGWLMGLLAWLVVASRETTSQLLIVVLVTFVIGVSNLHHSIAGAVEVLMGVLANVGPTLADYWRVVALSVVGNAVGGTVFVALLKFGHVQASRST